MKMWLVRLFSLLIIFSLIAIAQTSAWRFAVSGDSRNCGSIAMPAIAQGAQAGGALFYWHLGGFRAIYRIERDCAQTHRKSLIGTPGAGFRCAAEIFGRTANFDPGQPVHL
jgi:hypothetical protein